jgi:hypothetical protein
MGEGEGAVVGTCEEGYGGGVMTICNECWPDCSFKLCFPPTKLLGSEKSDCGEEGLEDSWCGWQQGARAECQDPGSEGSPTATLNRDPVETEIGLRRRSCDAGAYDPGGAKHFLTGTGEIRLVTGFRFLTNIEAAPGRIESELSQIECLLEQ